MFSNILVGSGKIRCTGKCARYLQVGLGVVLLLTESRHFQIVMKVFEHILHEELFYKRRFTMFLSLYDLSSERKNVIVAVWFV